MLPYRERSIYGNPWPRLLRREAEALVKRKQGDNCLKEGAAGEDGTVPQPRTEAAESPNRRAGGDDGARTRNLRRDRFGVWACYINDLPVFSVA